MAILLQFVKNRVGRVVSVYEKHFGAVGARERKEEKTQAQQQSTADGNGDGNGDDGRNTLGNM